MMSPATILETPVIENRPFLLRDPMMIEDANFLKEYENDSFSRDSWEKVSTDELDILKIPDALIDSPPPSHTPSTSSLTEHDTDIEAEMSIKSENSDGMATMVTDLGNLDSPPVLIKMDENIHMKMDENIPDKLSSRKQNALNDSAETRAMKRERNRLAARRCRQKQKDRIDFLEKDVKEIETENFKVENEIKLLHQQLKELQNALANHDCMLKHNHSQARHHYYTTMKF